jgi:uncharacterized membrane protein YfcA
MWAYYRRRFLLNQILFAAVIVAARFINPERGWLELLALWLILQVAALPGAWAASRLARKIAEAEGRLPLDRR